MLRSAKTIEHLDLQAKDGPIGSVRDLYFDDQSWEIRYLVVDTGSWLTGRRVLISPKAVNGQEWQERVLRVDLTKDQVRESPSFDAEKPVSRQHEASLHAYYGWPVYWGGTALGGGIYPGPLGGAAIPPEAYGRPPEKEADRAGVEAGKPEGDPHLRSVNEVRKYQIEAADGSLGHLDDVLIDPRAWRTWYIVVDTRNWWPGKKVLVACTWITRVSWSEQVVHVDLSREHIKGGPEYDPAREVNRDYAERLHEYYGRSRPHEW